MAIFIKHISMTKFTFLFTALLLAQHLQAQQNNPDTIDHPKKLDEVLIYANKFPERSRRIAQSVSVIRSKDVLQWNGNTGDVLQNSGTVFLQKSQQGGGSPVIRGFEASRVLLMVDGIRMNNAIYRTGHLQNIITVDNMILDRIEVLYGPSSTIYGSDALGGVVSMTTKNPLLSKNDKEYVTGSALFRYGSVNQENRAHMDVNFGNKKWASLTSLTYSSFGELVQGKKRSPGNPAAGRLPYYVQTVGSTDRRFNNPDPNKQLGTAYNQYDLLQKILFQPKENITHLLNIQISTTGNIPRHDRLSEIAGTNPRFAEWYYGPQKRNLLAYQLNAGKLAGYFSDVKMNISFQDIEESRITRRFGNPQRQEREENINVWGYNFDAIHREDKHELHVGIDFQFNYLKSTAQGVNIATNAIDKIVTRYPDGKNRMNFGAVYLQHTWKINDHLTLNEGVRLSNVSLKSTIVDNSITNFPFTDATQKHNAVTANLGLVYAPNNTLRIGTQISTGFRSPNFDDLTKIFDTRAGAVTVPNPGLKPEYTYNAELNFNKVTTRVTLGGSVFYTLFRNAIVVDTSTFNGSKKILYDGVISDVFSNTNKGRAYLYGASLNGEINITDHFAASAAITYTYGRYEKAVDQLYQITFYNNTRDSIRRKDNKVPLDHVPPVYGRAALSYKWNGLKAETSVLFNGAKNIEDYNLDGEDNLVYATIKGTPSWYTLNFNIAYQLNKSLSVNGGIENILDKNYRTFASGISAPGRNFLLSMRAGF
jgi:hemoglobin/transferrin/lactoferrin receptor protein